jgi:F0F1-type ATP synthase alpha subunit
MIHSFKVAATLSAYRGVALLSVTANTVAYPESSQNPYIGITKNEVTDTNQAIQVACAGERVKLYFNDTCAAGKLVGLNSSGQGIPFNLSNTTTSATLAGQYIGILLGASVAATGTVAEILVQPGFVRVSTAQ